MARAVGVVVVGVLVRVRRGEGGPAAARAKQAGGRAAPHGDGERVGRVGRVAVGLAVGGVESREAQRLLERRRATVRPVRARREDERRLAERRLAALALALAAAFAQVECATREVVQSERRLLLAPDDDAAHAARVAALRGHVEREEEQAAAAARQHDALPPAGLGRTELHLAAPQPLYRHAAPLRLLPLPLLLPLRHRLPIRRLLLRTERDGGQGRRAPGAASS